MMAADGFPRGPAGEALEFELRRLARAGRLLVGADFDGTLADIVDHPDQVAADPAAVGALRDLAVLPHTRVAIISGRALAVLRRHLGRRDFVLVGSHGAEVGGADEDLSPALDERAERALARAADELQAIADAYEGALVERKPTAVAFHYRQVPEDRRAEAARRAGRIAEATEGLRAQPGHMVLELLVGDTTKGEALDVLRAEHGPDATLFVGDDRTDEHAFARLGPSDLSVKVGPGDTCARVRVPDRSAVAPLIRRLYELRRA